MHLAFTEGAAAFRLLKMPAKQGRLQPRTFHPSFDYDKSSGKPTKSRGAQKLVIPKMGDEIRAGEQNLPHVSPKGVES